MKFDFIIGNPPYQEQTDSDSTRMPPLYDKFMEESIKLSKKVELITPARFLFNAGYTPKAWNEKMLNDKHFKVLLYEPNSNNIFPSLPTPIKGGIAITFYDLENEYTPIGIFTSFPELNGIVSKVRNMTDHFLPEIISSPLNFVLSDKMKKEHPDLLDRLRTSAFTKLADIFYEQQPNDSYEYVAMLGLLDNKRVYRYIRKDYINEHNNTLGKYKLFVPKVSGIGAFGEILSPTVIGTPGEAYTQTFIAIGEFDTREEAENVSKYLKTKFVRCMLSVLKVTPDCPGPKWAHVPVQDFSLQSDINWGKSISEIDKQLYQKYGLSEKEISFIETKVKEMQ